MRPVGCKIQSETSVEKYLMRLDLDTFAAITVRICLQLGQLSENQRKAYKLRFEAIQQNQHASS
jgi:hypothetical protein